MKNVLKIILVLLIIMVYTVSKVQRIHNKSEAVSRAIKRAEQHRIIDSQTLKNTNSEIKSRK